MTILHIASINNSLFNGVCVIVPRHIQAHARCENAGFVNIRNIEINNISPRFDYTENFSWDTVASAALAEYRKICTSAGT